MAYWKICGGSFLTNSTTFFLILSPWNCKQDVPCGRCSEDVEVQAGVAPNDVQTIVILGWLLARLSLLQAGRWDRILVGGGSSALTPAVLYRLLTSFMLWSSLWWGGERNLL